MENLNIGHESGEPSGSRQEYQEALGIAPTGRHQPSQRTNSHSHTTILLQMLEETRRQNALLMARLDSQPSPNLNSPLLPRPRLPPLHEFDGTRTLYSAWRIEVDTKLKIDWEAIGGEAAAVGTIFASLTGPARVTCATRVSEILSSPHPSTQSFLTYLDDCYLDRHAREQAQRKLAKLRQGNQSFATFLPEFERLLHEAGGGSWPESIKIEKFRDCVSRSLLLAVSVVPEQPTTLNDWIRYLSNVSNERDYLLGGSSYTAKGHRQVSTFPVESMDWEPVKANIVNTNGCDGPGLPTDAFLRGKRARWVDKDLINKRKMQGQCLRCARKGCSPRFCPLAAAQRPQGFEPRNKQPAAQVTTMTAEEVAEVAEDISTAGRSSGKV